MDLMYPRVLKRGDVVCVIAPARSRAMVAEPDHSAVIEFRFRQMGLNLSFGEQVYERDAFYSSSVASRIEDLRDAFADPNPQSLNRRSPG